jgi:hypothetical protein
MVYVAGRPGTAGLVDLQADIVLDGGRVTEEVDLLLSRDRPRPAERST